MSTGRIAAALRLDDGESLAVLCGPGVQDHFVGPDGVVLDLERALDRVLRERGLDRVVFTRPGERVYSYRPDWYHAPETTAALTVPSPLGDVTRPETAPRTRALPDAHLSRLLSGLLADGRQRTALVVLMADDFLRMQKGAAAETVGALVADCARGAVPEGNLLLLVFTAASVTGVREQISRTGSYTPLETFLDRQLRRSAHPGAATVGMAGPDELRHLITARGVPARRPALRWTPAELDPAVVAMAAQPGESITNWSAALDRLAADGQALSEASLRAAGMIDGPPGARDPLRALASRHGTGQLLARIEYLRDLLALGRDRDVEPPSLHLIFTGSPGTGKTTAAQLVGHSYRAIGALRRGHTHAVAASDIIGQFVGQTPHLVDTAVRAALDGVLFIDEAYQLSDDPRGHGREAITTLVRNMEELRDRLVVIAAGYPREMRDFVSSNVGLASRFGEPITFPDFTDGQLHDILAGFLGSYGIGIGDEGHAALRRLVEELPDRGTESFGNARTMRELAGRLAVSWRRTRRRDDEPFGPRHLPGAEGHE